MFFGHSSPGLGRHAEGEHHPEESECGVKLHHRGWHHGTRGVSAVQHYITGTQDRQSGAEPNSKEPTVSQTVVCV